MEKPLYIDIWGEVQRKNAQNQCRLGLSGLASFQLDETQIHKTAYHLSKNLHLGRGSEGSWYTLFIPVLNNSEVVKIRISDHLSTEDEWRQHEITGLPNRRYSIVIYNRHSMYIQHKKKQHYIDWEKYEVDGIDVYELCVHCNYVPTCWRYLYYVIKEIYLGGRPEETNIPHMKDSGYKRDFEVSKEWNRTMDKPINQKQDDYLENITDKNESKNMTKKITIRLTESELKQIITESVKQILSANEEMLDESWLNNIRDTYNDIVTSRINPEKYQRYRQNRYYQDAKNAQQQGNNLSVSQRSAIRRGDEKLAQRKANSQRMVDRARSEYVDTANGRSNPYRTDATARNTQRTRNTYQTYLKRNNNIQGNNNPY